MQASLPCVIIEQLLGFGSWDSLGSKCQEGERNCFETVQILIFDSLTVGLELISPASLRLLGFSSVPVVLLLPRLLRPEACPTTNYWSKSWDVLGLGSSSVRRIEISSSIVNLGENCTGSPSKCSTTCYCTPNTNIIYIIDSARNRNGRSNTKSSSTFPMLQQTNACLLFKRPLPWRMLMLPGVYKEIGKWIRDRMDVRGKWATGFSEIFLPIISLFISLL